MATVDKNYIYSIGRVKELEKGLLVKVNLDRVFEADEPLPVLRSIGFFKATEEYEEHASLDEIFGRERMYNRRQLHELVALSPLEDIFLLPYDIHNIKLLLKGRLRANPAIKEFPMEEGKFARSELIKAIYEESPIDLPASLKDDIVELLEEFQNTQRFAIVDYRLDRRLRLLQLEIACAARSPFLAEYVHRLSDLQNLATMVRRKTHLLGRETLSEALLDTGTLSVSFFERLYDSGWESIATALKTTEYGRIAAKAFAQVEQTNFLPTVDFWCADYLIEFLRRTRRFAFGIEPVLAFYLARDHELKIVRAILNGKRFHYPQERLNIRVKPLYG